MKESGTMKETVERKAGHSKLVYDKATRTIKTVDPNPPMTTDTPREVIARGRWDRAQKAHAAYRKRHTVLSDYSLTPWEEASQVQRELELAQADADLTALRENWAIVPREPTEDMIMAGDDAYRSADGACAMEPAEEAYCAMIRAYESKNS